MDTWSGPCWLLFIACIWVGSMFTKRPMDRATEQTHTNLIHSGCYITTSFAERRCSVLIHGPHCSQSSLRDWHHQHRHLLNEDFTARLSLIEFDYSIIQQDSAEKVNGFAGLWWDRFFLFLPNYMNDCGGRTREPNRGCKKKKISNTTLFSGFLKNILFSHKEIIAQI